MKFQAARFLELSLVLTSLVHVLAMFGMALFLMPALPGATTSDAARLEYIAANPGLWHLGWLPWHACALSDLLLAIALVKTNWVPKLPATITLILTILAVALGQPAELMWNIHGSELACISHKMGQPGCFFEFEKVLLATVVALATVLNALMVYCWTWCFASSNTWSREQTRLSVVTGTLLLLAGAAHMLPAAICPPQFVIFYSNAIGFCLMTLWFILASEAVLSRSRPEERNGRMAQWRHPRRDAFGKALTAIGNSRLLRYACESIPSIKMISDIEDVVYLNYLIDASRIEPLVPCGLELQRLGPNKTLTLFSVLTYRHGHFGPAMLGHFRRMLPSPVQSNWRIYVRDQEGVAGIYFLTTAVTATTVSLGARIMAEGLPMHVPQSGAVTCREQAGIEITLVSGAGSAPDLQAKLKACQRPELEGNWKDCFDDFDSFLAYCVPQDRAISVQPWYRQCTRQEIDLGIALTDCEPMSAEIISTAIDTIAGVGESAVCFRVPKVSFAFKGTIVSPIRLA